MMKMQVSELPSAQCPSGLDCTTQLWTYGVLAGTFGRNVRPAEAATGQQTGNAAAESKAVDATDGTRAHADTAGPGPDRPPAGTGPAATSEGACTTAPRH